MRTFLVTCIVLALIAVLVVDGLGMYRAHRLAVEIAQGAARQAAEVYVASRNSETAALAAVEGIAREADAEVVEAALHKAESSWYQVTVKIEPQTYVLGHLPYVRHLLVQESTAKVHLE
jgi:hypothetical protein